MFVLRKVILRSAAKKRLFSARQFSSTIGNNNNGFLSCSYPDVEIPNASVQDVVFSNADKWGNKIATVCINTRHKFKYDDNKICVNNIITNKTRACFAKTTSM